MKIFNNTNISNYYKKSALAIGNFDGVHLGHQKVFRETRLIAKRKKIKFGVLTFSPLPVMFFNKNIKNHRLVSENQKLKLLKKNKVDNFKFGRNIKGDVSLLKKFSKKYGYKLLNIKPYKKLKKIVSSTVIREYLQTGHINFANKLLSKTWFVEGIVKRGKKIGRKLGYRTCNINIKNYILPKSGIYAVRVMIGKKNKIYKGISYLGSRPTFAGKEIILETNIFNIKKNLYKKKLRIFFIKFLRKDLKFHNSKYLIRQMNKDVIYAKKGLKEKLVI